MAPLMDDKPLFAKERADGSYSLASYYCARILIGVPTMMISWLVGGTILYWSTGLNNSPGAYVYYIIMFLINGTCAQAICQLMAFTMPTREFAQGFGFLPVVFGMLFAGFYVSYENIPPWWIWAYWALLMTAPTRPLDSSAWNSLQIRAISSGPCGRSSSSFT